MQCEKCGQEAQEEASLPDENCSAGRTARTVERLLKKCLPILYSTRCPKKRYDVSERLRILPGRWIIEEDNR
jgi:hypothetical protein